MMEESNDVLSEENKADLEKKKGRRFKTPSQIQALEEFYSEHKYPTESMKAELAESLGLTDKQVSGWFCHRRLKDKRVMKDEALGTGRQDLSSGVIQDRGSGLRQDSCGSTKQTDHVPSDLREVESCRLYGEDQPLVEPINDQRRHYHVSGMEMDDTSSESSSDIREEQGFYPQSRDLLDVESSQYVASNGFASKGRGRKGPSGYLKIKGQTENAAITAVKRQLGKHYKVDGPPLGVDFEPLPPGAFQFQKPYNDLEPILQSPVDNTTRCKQAGFYNMSPDTYEESVNIRNFHGSDPDILPYRRSQKLKPFVSPSHSNPYPYEKSSFKIDEFPAIEVSAYDSSFNHDIMNRHRLKGLRPDSFSKCHIQPSIGKLPVEHDQPWEDEYADLNPKTLNRREMIESRSQSSAVKRRDPFTTQGGVPCILMDEEFEGRRSQPLVSQDNKELYGSLIREQARPRLKPGKRGRDEARRENYAMQSSHDQLQCAKPFRGSAAEIPSNFSDDETAETSSSVD
ncbi:hypothetical protein Dimus_021462 [Dionaea muscipula]